MALLRFANPGSDFERLVMTYRRLYGPTRNVVGFSLDVATETLIRALQVSSSGAVGDEALRRSTRTDRSRDPLYNQLKMYTELYRLMGWIHPVGRKLEFAHTLLGEQVAEAPDVRTPEFRGLLRECLLGITFPNPNSESVGVDRLRFFPLLLGFMEALEGCVSRDEIIVGVYTVVNDAADGLPEARARLIKRLRGKHSRLLGALEDVARANGVQVNTLQNYTRFPLGALKSSLIGWATPRRVKGPYERSVVFYCVSEDARQQVRDYFGGVDVRREQLQALRQGDRAFLLNLGFYGMMQRAGYDVAAEVALVRQFQPEFPGAMETTMGRPAHEVYLSPFQQADHADIDAAKALWRELESHR